MTIPPGELGDFNGPISFLFLLVMEPYKELFVFSLATEYFFYDRFRVVS